MFSSSSSYAFFLVVCRNSTFPLVNKILRKCHSTTTRTRTSKNMNLSAVVSALNSFAPLHLAQDWDNVGLLVEPSDPHKVSNILLTNDLTLKVLEEAIEKKSDMIISYHPPIFEPLKRLTQLTWKESIIARCLENRIAVYSPHTCWDVVKGGTNDWLVSAFEGKVKPLKHESSKKIKVRLYFDETAAEDAQNKVKEELVRTKLMTLSNFKGFPTEFLCSSRSLEVLLNFCEDVQGCCVESTQICSHSINGCGEGRIVELKESISIQKAIELIKSHLNLTHVQLALGYQLNDDSLIKTVAACAGSGASVLKGVNADLFLTGEMSHHDALRITHQNGGRSGVVLCGHSNTERGFLEYFMKYLKKSLNESVSISLSKNDQDPLKIV